MSNNKGYQFSDNYFIGKLTPHANRAFFKALAIAYPLQMFIALLIVLISLFIYGNTQQKIEDAKELERLKSIPLLFTEDFNSIADDLDVLKNGDFLRSYLNDPGPGSFEEVEQRLLFFTMAKRDYHQLRLLDINGRETVRVNHVDKSFYILSEELLQDKSDRYYFSQISKLKENQIYISPMDLNVEYGRIEVPHVLTVRFGIPLYNDNDELKGSLILNFNMNHLLQSILHSQELGRGSLFLIDEEDKYIYDSRQKRDLTSKFLFSDDFPELANKVADKDIQQFHWNNQLITSYKFNFLDLMEPTFDYDGISRDSLNLQIIKVSQPVGFFNFLQHLESYLIFIFVLTEIVLFFLMAFLLRNVYIKRNYARWLNAFFQGIENNPASILLTDKEGKIVYTNKMFLELTGYEKEEIYGENPRILKSGFLNDSEYENLWKTISSGKTWTGEFHNRKKDNSLFWVYASISPIETMGEVSGYLGVQEDISENKKLKSRLEELASTDPLTGLLNRRAFFSKVETEMERCLRHDYEFVVLMADLDHFKNINDQYGHQVGDEVLMQTAQLLIEESRKIDIIGRYGGEEFIIVLPETDMEQGLMFAERLRVLIEDKEFIHKKLCPVTISIGLAQWKREENLEKTISRADSNLYYAKSTGRNKVIG